MNINCVEPANANLLRSCGDSFHRVKSYDACNIFSYSLTRPGDGIHASPMRMKMMKNLFSRLIHFLLKCICHALLHRCTRLIRAAYINELNSLIPHNFFSFFFQIENHFYFSSVVVVVVAFAKNISVSRFHFQLRRLFISCI